MNTGLGVREGCCLSPILFNLCRECITKEALEGFGDLRIGGQVIRNVEYAGMLPLIVRKKWFYRLIKIGRYYGM